jgi:hypothetical protein
MSRPWVTRTGIPSSCSGSCCRWPISCKESNG